MNLIDDTEIEEAAQLAERAIAPTELIYPRPRLVETASRGPGRPIVEIAPPRSRITRLRHWIAQELVPPNNPQPVPCVKATRRATAWGFWITAIAAALIYCGFLVVH